MTPVVVIVDDDREILQAIARTLRGEPHVLHTFDDPTRALRFIGEHRVDALVADIDMPQMSGLELMRRARELIPGAGRIIVSGATSIDAAVQAINGGAVHRFLRKPFDPVELRAAVASVSGKAAAGSDEAPLDPRAAWRTRMERECPTLSRVALDADGRYLIDGAALEAVAPALGLEHLIRMTP